MIDSIMAYVVADLMPALTGYVQSRLECPSSVDEVVQRSLVTIWRKVKAAEVDHNLRGYCFGVARRELGTYRRENKRQRTALFSKIDQRLNSSFDPSSGAPRPSDYRSELAPDSTLATELYQSGQTVNQIAKSMGYSVRRIHDWTKDTKTTDGKFQRKVDPQIVLQLSKTGLSQRVIGERFGISRQAVAKIINKEKAA